MKGPTQGQRIKMLREAHGDSQEAFAKKIGQQQPQVCRWENDEFAPSMKFLKRIIRAYPDMDIKWFVMGEDDE